MKTISLLPQWRHTGILGFYRVLFPAMALCVLALGTAPAAGQATHFQFLPSSSGAGLYSVDNSVTFQVQAQNASNSPVAGFNDNVVVGLYSTATSQISDPEAVYTSGGTTYIGSAPLSFVGGTASFGITFEAGSNSEQVVLQDLSASPVTVGTNYPGSLGVTTGQAMTVRGFESQPFFPRDFDFNGSTENPPADITPFHYTVGGSTDPLSTDDSTVTFFSPGDYGDIVPSAGGVAGSSGIDTNAACYLIQGFNGGFASGGAGVSVRLWLSAATGIAPVTYQVILDYDGSLTDYNNPVMSKDTVLQGAVTTGSGAFSFFTSPPVTVAGFQPYKPFMLGNGQVIFRIWTGAGDSVTLKYANETIFPTDDNTISFIKVPYSPQNVLPLRSTITAPSYTATPATPPYVLAGSSPITLIDTFQNQFSSPLTQIIFQIPADPLGVQNWVVSSVPAPTGTHPLSTATVLQASGTAPGAVTLDFSASSPVTTNEVLPISIIGQSPATAYAWPLSILSATTNTGSTVPSDSTDTIVNTIGVPDTPKNFTAVPVSFVAPGTGGAVSLSWSQSVSQNPQGYIITRSGGAAFTPVTLSSPVSIYYVDSTALNLTAYNYSIVSYNAVVQSGAASAGPVTAYANPATITTLSALTGGTTVQLNWSAAVSAPGSYAVAGYQIWRDIQASMATAVSLTTVGNVVTYNDTTVTGGNHYYYELATIDNQYAGGVTGGPHNSGLSSAQAIGFPLGNPPNSLAATLVTNSPATIQVSWMAPVSNLNSPVSYLVSRAVTTGASSPYTLVSNTGASVTINDGAVTAGSYYVYTVAGINGAVTTNPAGPVTGFVGPAAPSSLHASAGPAAVTLTWPAVPASPGETVSVYNIYQNGTLIGTPVPAIPVTVTAIDTTPLQGINYTYQVTSVDTNGVEGAKSPSVTSALPPLVPQSFGVTVQQTGVSFDVAVTWSAPVSSANVTTYKIWNNPTNNLFGSGSTTLLATVPFNYTQPYLDDESLALAGKTIFYWIKGVDPGGAGVSAITGVQIPPNPPTPVTASASASAITIGWAAITGENVSKYTVYRAPLPAGTPAIAVGTATPGTAVSFTDSGPLTLGANYAYYVTATDPGSGTTILGGESLPSASVTAAVLPPAPTGLTAALNAASDNVTLTWNSQLSSEPNLQSYTLSRTINGVGNTILQTAAGSVTTYVDTGITSANAGQTILYYLLATNSAGGSSAQEGPVGLQVPPNPPGTPTPSASSSAITVNWTPNGLDGNGFGQNVSQYTVYRNSGSGFVSIGTATIPPFIDNGSVNGPLAYGSTYTYELTATNPGGGTGVPGGTSAYSAASAPWGLAPATPAGLAVSLLDNLNDTAFTWTGITDASVTAVYALAATVNSPASAVTTKLAASVVSQYFAAQTGDATYYYWLEAVNPYGASAPAGPVSQLSYPAPVNFAPVSLGPNQATVLSWVTLGADVTSYVESREISGSNNFTQSQTITAVGLQLPVTLALPFTAGVIYDYEITAINATGTGPNSSLQPFSYLPTAPVSVTAVSGTSNLGVTVNLSWADPGAASQAVTGYTIYKSTAQAGPYAALVSLPGTTYSDSGAGVTATGVYYYIISADDNLGQQGAVTAVNAVAVTAFALPNPPGSPFTATAYNGSVTLSWSAAVSTTYPVSIYQIQRAGGGVTTNFSTANSPYGDTSVTNGVTYVYNLQTEDSHGNFSSTVGPANALPLAPPGAPTSLNIGSGDTQLLLSWNAGTPGTLPIGTYQIYRSTGGAYSLLTTVSGTTTGYLDQGLTDGSNYSYYMVSVDTSGSTTGLDVSSNSATVSGAPAAGEVNPPSTLAAAAGVSQVILTWTDSITVTGPAAVTGYSIFQETGSSGFVSIGTLVPTGASEAITETGLTNGDLYSYYLVAHSSTSTSAASATVLGIPSAPPAAPTPVIGTDGINKDVLDWGASPAQGSVTIKQYVITQAVLPGASGTLATTAGSVTFYTDTNPANDGQTVVYQVEAVNSNGTTGALSAPVTDYPYASFPATITSHSAGTAAVTLNFTQATPLSWAPLTQLDILRTPVLGGASVAITTGNLASPYIDSTGIEGTLYVYTMEAVDSKGHISVLSNAVTDGPSIPPAAPATFVVTAGNQQVLLDWPASAPVSGAIPVSFYLLAVNGAAPVTVPATQTWYLDSPLGNGVGVTVSLQAVDDSGVTVGNHASTVVGPVTVTTNQNALNPPTGLTATAKAGNSVLLNWTPPNDEGRVIKSFNVFRSGSFLTTVGSPLATVNNPALAPVTAYTDNSATPGTTYYYAVQAVYSQPATALGPTASPNSNNAVVTTPAGAAGVPPVTVGVMAFNANLLKPLTGQQLGIYFVAPDSGPVELDVYNISGHPIRALYATAIADVAVNVTWDGKDRDGSWAASGIYLIEIKAPGLHQIKKVLVVK